MNFFQHRCVLGRQNGGPAPDIGVASFLVLEGFNF